MGSGRLLRRTALQCSVMLNLYNPAASHCTVHCMAWAVPEHIGDAVVHQSLLNPHAREIVLGYAHTARPRRAQGQSLLQPCEKGWIAGHSLTESCGLKCNLLRERGSNRLRSALMTARASWAASSGCCQSAGRHCHGMYGPASSKAPTPLCTACTLAGRQSKLFVLWLTAQAL